jgi:hypothetical protein
MKKFEICKSLLGIDEDYSDYENEITNGIGIEQDQVRTHHIFSRILNFLFKRFFKIFLIKKIIDILDK